MASQRRTWVVVVVTVVVVLVVGGALALVFPFTGIYNVSAMVPHNGMTLWMMDEMLENSVAARAKDIEVPADLAQESAREGMEHYRPMCEPCHGGPGVERSEFGQGLYPLGPDLVEAAEEMEPAELFWIVKNGIKMTGMPSFGVTHPDRQIWTIVAFLEKLPGMTDEQYAALRAEVPAEEHEEGEEHEHGEEHMAPAEVQGAS